MFQKKFLAVLTLILISVFISSFAQEEQLMNKAKVAIEEDRYKDAIKSLNKVLESSPKNVYALYNRGICYLYTEQNDKALKDFNKIISINPKFADVYNSRGLIYAYQDEYEKAISDFNKAIELDSTFGRAYFSRGNIYLSMNNIDRAFDDYNKAAKYDPSNPAIYHQRGGINYMKNKIPEAIDDYTKAIDNGIRNNKIYFNRGNAFFRSDKFEEAIKDYTNALALDSTDKDALNNRAMAYEKSNQSEKAIADRKLYSTKFGSTAFFPSVDSIKFVTYKSKNDEFSMELPEGWNVLDTIGEKFHDVYITPVKLNNAAEFYSVGVKLSLNKNVSKYYKVSKDAHELMDFWKQSSRANGKEYYYYSVITEKIYPKRGDYVTNQNHVQIQAKADSPQLELYEYVLTKDDVIFYCYLQSLTSEWNLYQKIFDKAVKTIKLNID